MRSHAPWPVLAVALGAVLACGEVHPTIIPGACRTVTGGAAGADEPGDAGASPEGAKPGQAGRPPSTGGTGTDTNGGEGGEFDASGAPGSGGASAGGGGVAGSSTAGGSGGLAATGGGGAGAGGNNAGGTSATGGLGGSAGAGSSGAGQAGNGGFGGQSSLITSIDAVQSAACTACETENGVGPAEGYLHSEPELEALFPGTLPDGAPKAQLYWRVLQCARTSHCAVPGNEVFCYCGSTTISTCDSGGGTGACRALIEQGLASTDPGFIRLNFTNVAFPGGLALNQIVTDNTNGCVTGPEGEVCY